MCGICGSVGGREAYASETILRQLGVQRHRGPDAEGYFTLGRGVIAQNRLSVIDLVTGDPPVTDEHETIGAVLNGEIYNFAQLRDELRGRGHVLSTVGDTEVLVHLAEDHDAVQLARRLDGMFAFAVWDGKRERLILARDRLGKKPLYYWNANGTFVFGSEIKALLAHPAVKCEPNPRAVSAYLTFGYVPTPETFFDGIYSLRPGHVMTVDAGAVPKIERYWSLAIPGVDGTERYEGLDLEEGAREVRRLLTQAIRRRLVADVPLGAFLSGGIDSSAIVAIMAGVLGEPVKTFTIGFEDQDGFDERPFALAVARRFGTDHHVEVAHPETVELVERLVWHHDQPFGDSSAVPTYLVNEVARKNVTVALSGDGGDELFAGYERFAAGVAVEAILRTPGRVRDVASAALAWMPPGSLRGRIGRAQRLAASVEAGLPGAYLEWISYVPDTWRRRLLSQQDDWGRNDYEEIWRATHGAKTLDRLLALNIRTYLLDDLLVKMDRTSMAHSLEVRSPFLDTELVEFAMRLAPGLKARGLSLKRVLKRAVADLLPPEILSRPKRGFGVPLDRWFREDLDTYTTSMLGDGSSVRNHVNPQALDRLLFEHRSGGGSHGHALWTLLTLEIFLRKRGW
jgi:asparagine synthase (glutamine-hydrolysing)